MFFPTLIIFAAAFFTILNTYARFLDPSVGFTLVKSKNLTFSFREKVFFGSLPATCCFANAMFANLILKHSFSKAMFFQTWTFEITFNNTA